MVLKRIALISDIHFGRDARTKEFSLPGSRHNGNEQNAASISAGAIEIMSNMKTDYMFVAGDLTSVGSPAEFHFCEKMIEKMASEANIDIGNVVCCSGNHDNDWNISKIADSMSNGENDLTQIYKDGYRVLATSVVKQNLKCLYHDFYSASWPMTGVFEDETIIVFVLNSSTFCIHRDEDELPPHGKLTVEQLNWFRKEAENRKNDPRWKIVLLHHHPFNYPFPVPGADPSSLEEGSELCNIAGMNGIDIIIHGHRHHPRCKTQMESGWKKPITFICGGSFSAKETERLGGDIPNMFHIIELSDTVGDLKLYSYVYHWEGWESEFTMNNRIPLDREMYLGKVFDEKDVRESINRFNPVGSMCKISWEDLEEELKYMPSKNLEEQIEDSTAEWKKDYNYKVYSLDKILFEKK